MQRTANGLIVDLVLTHASDAPDETVSPAPLDVASGEVPQPPWGNPPDNVDDLAEPDGPTDASLSGPHAATAESLGPG